MGHHTFDANKVDNLEESSDRYRYLSRDELIGTLNPSAEDTIADLGSGTGFYTDDVAPFVSHIYAVDIQDAMHEYYRQKGIPENVESVTSDIATLPFEADHLDGAFSTMTYHEFTSEKSLNELGRVIASGGRIVIADWTADGMGEDGPSLDERFTANEASEALREVGFEIQYQATRPETFVIGGVRL